MRLPIMALSAYALLSASRALACPSCETALQARAALSERGDFWSQFLIVTLPLMLMSLIATALHRIGMKAPPEGRTAADHE
jgi:hypothetical protein